MNNTEKNKWLALSLALVLLLGCLTSCRRDLNYIISNKPSFEGVVVEVTQDAIMVQPTSMGDRAIASNETIRVPIATLYRDGSPGQLHIGDGVCIYYETIDHTKNGPCVQSVYAIFLTDPAQRPSEIS